MFSTLPQLHNGDSDIFFRNRSLFNEQQFVRKRVCKICDFRLEILFQFSVKNIFFKFHCNPRERSNVNSVILENCLCI